MLRFLHFRCVVLVARVIDFHRFVWIFYVFPKYFMSFSLLLILFGVLGGPRGAPGGSEGSGEVPERSGGVPGGVQGGPGASLKMVVFTFLGGEFCICLMKY